jgi:hypothetical protein
MGDVRLTRGSLSFELATFAVFLVALWGLGRKFYYLIRPVLYHPTALIGAPLLVLTYVAAPWLTVALFWSLLIWQRFHPSSYLRHVHHRVPSFFAGFRYRHRLRHKLEAAGLVGDKDSPPLISRVSKNGCITKVWIKMAYGDKIDFWRERAPQLAQTFNAGEVTINPYRRNRYTSIRFTDLSRRPPFAQIRFGEKVTKHRWLECDFLVRDPFSRAVGFEFIDFHRGQIDDLRLQGSPVGSSRDGGPYLLKIGTHLLVIAMSGRGKTNAERAMVYADYPLVMEGHDQHDGECDGSCGLLENWIFDGKRGTEAKAMPGVFARHEYGAVAESALGFFRGAELAMYRRLDEMGERGENLFMPEPGRRAVKIYIDEIMILESAFYSEVRRDIYRSSSAILQMGRSAGFSIIAYAQSPKLEKMPLRDDFPEVQIGGLQSRRQIDTAVSSGWDLGAREIPKDLPGVFYVKTDTGMMLDQMRYAHDRHDAIKRLPQCPRSIFDEKALPKDELRERVREKVLIA